MIKEKGLSFSEVGHQAAEELAFERVQCGGAGGHRRQEHIAQLCNVVAGIIFLGRNAALPDAHACHRGVPAQNENGNSVDGQRTKRSQEAFELRVVHGVAGEFRVKSAQRAQAETEFFRGWLLVKWQSICGSGHCEQGTRQVGKMSGIGMMKFNAVAFDRDKIQGK